MYAVRCKWYLRLTAITAMMLLCTGCYLSHPGEDDPPLIYSTDTDLTAEIDLPDSEPKIDTEPIPQTADFEIDTETDPGTDTDADIIMDVNREELAEYDATGQIMFYWYNKETNEYNEVYTPINPMEPSTDPPTVEPASDNYLCMMSNPNTIEWGGGLVVGFELDDEGFEMARDLTFYNGVGFWASRKDVESDPLVDVCLQDINTHPQGGRCGTDYNCHEDWCQEITLEDGWTYYTILFEELEQSGPSQVLDHFEQTAVYSIKFQSMMGEYANYCLDEVILVRPEQSATQL